MQNKQLAKYLQPGFRNLSESPVHMVVGDTAFCTIHNSVLVLHQHSPFWTIVLAKTMNEDNEPIFLVQDPEEDSHWVHASYFWTKEQVVRLLVCGPKGVKGARKYKRVMRKIKKPIFSKKLLRKG